MTVALAHEQRLPTHEHPEGWFPSDPAAWIACCIDMESCIVTGDPRGDVLLQTVESLAEAHDGFAQLFDIAALLADSERLYGHMVASPGMTTYVFDRRAATRGDAQAVVMREGMGHIRLMSSFFLQMTGDMLREDRSAAFRPHAGVEAGSNEHLSAIFASCTRGQQCATVCRLYRDGSLAHLLDLPADFNGALLRCGLQAPSAELDNVVKVLSTM